MKICGKRLDGEGEGSFLGADYVIGIHPAVERYKLMIVIEIYL